jgi:hypothetical protein
MPRVCLSSSRGTEDGDAKVAKGTVRSLRHPERHQELADNSCGVLRLVVRRYTDSATMLQVVGCTGFSNLIIP